jgi:hypothetical protein
MVELNLSYCSKVMARQTMIFDMFQQIGKAKQEEAL